MAKKLKRERLPSLLEAFDEPAPKVASSKTIAKSPRTDGGKNAIYRLRGGRWKCTIVQEGEQQSVVRFLDSGLDQVVVNEWIVRLKD